jgi:TorA maturation chaperone TorD
MDRKDENNVLKGYNMLLYFAGTMIMFEPNDECITDFWTKGILRSLPVSSANPNFMRAASQLRESCIDSNFSGKLMHEDYFRLFTGQDSLAPAFESLYKNHTPATYNPESVSDFYKSYGWESRFKGKVDDDHLGVELLFLTLMIEKYLEFDDEACRREMKNKIRRYINKHILSWVPEWNKDVQAHSRTLGFKGVGTLIQACNEDILSIFNGENVKNPSEAEAGNIRNSD